MPRRFKNTDRYKEWDVLNNSFDNLDSFSEELLNNILDDPKKRDYYLPLKKIPHHLLEDKEILLKLIRRASAKNSFNEQREQRLNSYNDKAIPYFYDPQVGEYYLPDLLKRLSHSFMSNDKNREILIKLITSNQIWNHDDLKYLPLKLRKSKSFILNLFEIMLKKKNWKSDNLYCVCHKSLKKDKEIALLSIRLGLAPSHLAEEFKKDKDILEMYIKSVRNRNSYIQKKYSPNHSISFYKIQAFKLNTIKLSNAFVDALVKDDPIVYRALSKKHKNRKKLAWLAIKKNYNFYKDLPAKLKLDPKIMSYVFQREPRYVKGHVPFKSFIKQDLSQLTLSKKVKKYIFNYCKEELEANGADILEIAMVKARLLDADDLSKKNAKCNGDIYNLHLCKATIIKKLDQFIADKNLLSIQGRDERAYRFVRNIPFDLINDRDILLKVTELNRDTIFNDFWGTRGRHLSLNSKKQLNKFNFIKGHYKNLSLPKNNKSLRNHMFSCVLTNSRAYGLDKWDMKNFFGECSKAELQQAIKKDPRNIVLFYPQDRIKLVNNLNKQQINTLIQCKDIDILEDLHYHDYAFEFFGKSFKQNVELGKKIFRGWPNKQMLKIIDIYYLLNNESFVAFLKNIKEITIHESDFINLPKPLKHNKLFIKKVLNYKLELYESIGKSLQTDPEITDWVLSLKPQLAECLSVGQFHRLDTTNLHPATRKVIYRKYLSKSSAAGDVLEHAHMKQKLLQTNLQNEQAA